MKLKYSLLICVLFLAVGLQHSIGQNKDYSFTRPFIETAEDSILAQEYGFRIFSDFIGDHGKPQSHMKSFLSVDPLTKSYPELTPYQFASNMPIRAVDLDGLEHYFAESGQYIGTSPKPMNQLVYVIPETELTKYKNNLSEIDKAAKQQKINYNTIPIMSRTILPNDRRLYVSKSAMDIKQLLDQTHRIYGEGNNTPDMLAHLIWNREQKVAKRAQIFYNNGYFNKYVEYSDKYGVYNYTLYGMHFPFDEKSLETQKAIFDNVADAKDGGNTNLLYKEFYEAKKEGVSSVNKKIKVSMKIMKAIFDARLGKSNDAYPNYDGWRSPNGINIPAIDIPEENSEK